MGLRKYLLSEGRVHTLAIFFIAFVLRVMIAQWLHPEPAWDGVLYERAAVALSRGMGYVTYMYEVRTSDTVRTAYYPVGYPAILSLAYRAFGEHRFVLHHFGTVISAATVALAHRLCWRCSSPRAALTTGLVVALLPGPALFASSAMTEPLFGFFLALFLWLISKEPLNQRPPLWVLAGFVLALATYVRPQATLLIPFAPIALLYGRGPSIQRIGWLTVVLAMSTIIPVLPWTLRNCHAIDGCAFVSTNGGSNLAIGAVPRANGRYLQLTADDGCRGVVGETARDRCWRAVAVQSILAAPFRWIKLGGVKLDHTLSYEAFPLGYLRESHALQLSDRDERFWRRAITGPWRVYGLFALLAFVPWKNRARLTPIPRAAAVLCVILLATHLVFFGGDRYHLPLIALLAPLVALSTRGIDRWWRATL